MINLKDPIAETYKDMLRDRHEEELRNKRLLEEGRKKGYDVFRGNAETIRVCLENKRKNEMGIPFPNDPDERWEHIKKLAKISD